LSKYSSKPNLEKLNFKLSSLTDAEALDNQFNEEEVQMTI